MSYEAAIASFRRDKTTPTKSFIISPTNAVANWYARPSEINHIMGTIKREVLIQFPRF
jgi:hypothetical protein